jgi:hypothetical protein
MAMAAFAFSGCSEDSSVEGPKVVNEQPGDDPDPCTLAADAELEAISGRKPVRHESESFDGNGQCTWYDDRDYALFVVSITDADFFEPPLRGMMQYAPVTGVGDDAFLSSVATVYVRTPKLLFYAQSLNRVADGKVSEAIQAAETSLPPAEKDDVLTYEGSYRLAKIVVGRL